MHLPVQMTPCLKLTFTADGDEGAMKFSIAKIANIEISWRHKLYPFSVRLLVDSLTLIKLEVDFRPCSKLPFGDFFVLRIWLWKLDAPLLL